MSYRAKSFYSRVFEPNPDSNPGGVPSKSRWLVMNIDTVSPYDWVAISRDFRFSQKPYVGETSEAAVLAAIQAFVDSNEVVYGRNLVVDQNGEPWAVSERDTGVPVAITGAYDGVMITRDMWAPAGPEYQRITATIQDYVKESGVGPLDPPNSLFGYTKAEGQNQEKDPFLPATSKYVTPSGSSPNGGTAADSQAVSPWQVPSSETLGPSEKKSSPNTALIFAGAAAAVLAVYYVSKNRS